MRAARLGLPNKRVTIPLGSSMSSGQASIAAGSDSPTASVIPPSAWAAIGVPQVDSRPRRIGVYKMEG